ncbi:hypothetical protein LOTGIDRAFT_162805 [Lottia gigantea]|uniref:Uncharacterized protein n=1 Tax=Lottia gigantea TaxID=225164 RepID=V3ZLA8_LOTGI|nr:hypothetical protein LOTGIDRAFT_162805 [Lottia gigantea]ESO92153.1 hypothetical protein LOTGIDRAFT_162805 [Lottia gigantea]
MKSVVCLMVFLSISTDSDGFIQRYCDQFKSCFLCGCGDKSVFNISCEDKNDIILMEHGGNVMRESEYDSDDCPLDSYETCKESNSTSILKIQDRNEVYKNCMLKNCCEIINKVRIKSGNKRLMNYPFYCYPKSFLIDLSNEINENVEFPMIYFSGEKFVGQKIDCDCFFSFGHLYLNNIFINLKPDTCSKVKLFNKNQNLLNCSETPMLVTENDYIVDELKLEIRGMEPDVEDILFFRFWGFNRNINCSGCRNSTDITASRFHTTDSSTINIPATTPLATYSSTTDLFATVDPTTTADIPVSRTLAADSSAKDPTTIVYPTRVDHVPTADDERSRDAETSTIESTTPVVNINQTYNISTVILGGILTALIIINIVCITLYCFISFLKIKRISFLGPEK